MDEQVKKAIQRQLIRKAPSGFSSRVMNEVYQRSASGSYQPIISRKMWWGIGAIMLMFVVLMFVLPHTAGESYVSPDWAGAIEKKIDAIDFSWLSISVNMNWLAIAAVSLVILLLLSFDTYLFKRTIK